MQLQTSSILSEADKQLASAAVLRKLTQSIRPKPDLTMVEWAERFRWLAKGASAKAADGPIQYSTALAPHQIEPQLAMTDQSVQMVVLNMASQIGGKTEMLINCIGYHIHWRPTNIVVMYPTIDSSEKFSKKKLANNIDASPAIRDVLAPNKSRTSANTILTKDFVGGSLFLVGANSPPSLRQASGEVLIADEVDAYEESAGDEGDPLELLWKRGESYPNVVKVMSSTPTIEGQSRIIRAMDDSDYHKWFCPCPKCGAFQVLEWDHVRFKPDTPETAFYECDKCNGALSDDDRLAMYLRGEWRPTRPFRGIRGYFLPGLNCPWPAHKGFESRLHQMVVDYLRAKKKENTHKVWINTFKCEGWRLQSEELDYEPLIRRTERYGPDLPAGVLCLVASADVQADRIESHIIGFGEGEESWAIRFGVFMGEPDTPAPWNDLDAFLLQEFAHPCGKRLRVACAVVDMGHKPRSVLRFTKPRAGRRVYAVAGNKTPWARLISRAKKSTIRQAITFQIGGDEAKEIIFGRLKVEEPGPRFMHFPSGYGFDEEYFRQLTAERLVHHFEDGMLIKRTWEKRRERNEALDLTVYSLGALEILNPNWPALAKQLEVSPGPADNVTRTANEPTPQPAQPPRIAPVPHQRRMRVIRRSWAQRWR